VTAPVIPEPYLEPDQAGDEMSDETIRSLVGDLWRLHVTELGWLDTIYGYTKGILGVPEVPDGATKEIKQLARLSVKNVLVLVRDAFAQNLSVVGYRSSSGRVGDHPAWRHWQRNRMDARQAEVYRPALTYGPAYVTVLPSEHGPVWRTRSPRQLLAVYEDPVIDAWPQYAVEWWVTKKNARPHRYGMLYDARFAYKLDFGPLQDSETKEVTTRPLTLVDVTERFEHHATYKGRPVCPVVRFVNARDADDMIVGEVAPLIAIQQAINHVNFDRLIVCRHGAWPQKVISGWTGSREQVLKASAMRVWTFEDADVRAQSFAPASVEPYNAVLDEMLQHVAMVAQISPSQVTGKMANISAEALAAAEANQQRKLVAKRESFGESWEQVLLLSLEMERNMADAGLIDLAEPITDTMLDDEAAEVIWRDTEARAFAAVVDGITKLAGAGVPIEYLLHLVPGMTQQQVVTIQDAIRAGAARDLVSALLSQPAPAPAPAPPLSEALSTVEG